MNLNLLLIAAYIASLVIFCTIAKRLPILSNEAQHRVSPLDGLRGLLATAVIVHHFTVTYYWHTTGLWQTTDSRLINNMGAVPVSLFFMITGYLFASKIQRGAPDWHDLLSSRLRRIYPMYLFSVVLIAAIAFYQSADHLAPIGETLRNLGRWIIFIGSPINGFSDTTRINATVHWTLLYEVVFYLCLPVLYCLLHRRVPVKALVIGLLVLACLWTEYHHHFSRRMIKLFCAGIAVALLEAWLKRQSFNYSSPRWTVLAVLMLIAGLLIKSYSIQQMLLLVFPFALFVLGNSLHGLLEHRGMKILGEASFSIYLLHGIVIYLLFSVLQVFDFSTASFTQYACFLPLIILLVSSISVATYWGIERPFLIRRKVRQPATA